MPTTSPRSRKPAPLLALLTLLTAFTLVFATGCQSTASGNAVGSAAANPASAPAGAQNTAQTTAPDTTKLCGTPPCMRFVSRSETNTLEDTFTNHPIISAVAVHVVGSLLCGGILCLLGEGTGLVYIEHETKIAAGAHECLKVNILPSGAEWKVVDIKPSDEAPYCKD